MSSQRVSDAPIARTNDPITSFTAGENQAAREASEMAVLDILRGAAHHGIAFSAHDIATVAADEGDPWTPQRLRTATRQLIRKGHVIEAGRRANASPTGRSAMTYTLAEVTR